MPTESDGDPTITSAEQEIDPDDCATMVARVAEVAKADDQSLERRIETIDRIIDGLEKQPPAKQPCR